MSSMTTTDNKAFLNELARLVGHSHLLTVAKRKPETVNAHLTAVDTLTQWLGLGAASLKDGGQSTRVEIPETAPRALTPEETKRLL